MCSRSHPVFPESPSISGVPQGSRSPPGFLESPEKPGSLSHSGFPESTGTPDSRSSAWPQEIGGHLGDSGNATFWVIPWTRSSGWPREPFVLGSGWIRKSRFPGDSGNPVLRMTPQSPWWLQKPGITRTRSHPELRVPVVTWNSVFLVPPGTTGSRCHPELLVPGVTPGFRSHSERFP